MHLLIGLDEDDDRTLAASDAADGGDIDDVVEVLTAGGMRKAQHFVGVHWQPRTRIVAFGPVAAVVTLADGSEHDVRAPSAKVWTDLELVEHPERVVLRVLDENERTEPVPPQTLTPNGPVAAGAAGAAGASAAAPGADAGSAPGPDNVPEASPASPAPPVGEESQDGAAAPSATPVEAPAAGVPTFGAAAESSGASGRATGASWGRSWARSDEASSAPVAERPYGSAVSEPADPEPLAPEADSAGPVAKAAVEGAAGAARGDVDGGPVAGLGSNSVGAQAASGDDAGTADAPAAPAEPETPVAQVDSRPQADEPPAAPAAPAFRSWGSVAPTVPVRAAGPTAPAEAPAEAPAVVPAEMPAPDDRQKDRAQSASQPVGAPSGPVPAAPTPTPQPAPAPAAPATPVAADLPAAAPRDFESTWAARPALEPEDAEARTAAPTAAPTAPAGRPPAGGPTASDPADEDEPSAPPSYDYLFGHTTMADEHRKVLAQLSAPDDEEAHEDEDVPSVPTVADASDAPVTNAARAPEVPARPIPAAPQVPEGGLISSVPWATSAPAPSVPKPEPEAQVPSFSGRHTPPPAPSLLPPMNTPPPGARAPQATPLISTGPPPAPAAPAAPVVPSPAPTPPAPTPRTPTQPVPTQPVPPVSEPSFDVPISPPMGSTPAPTAAATPYRPITQPLPSGYGSGLDVDAAADDDETELTVDRSALLEARNAAQNQTFSGPSVLAVLCSAGHPTPPHSDRCRVCGEGIPPQEPFTMPRPPLGVLRLSTGDVVTLDRSVLLGRAPKLGDGLAAHDRPHVVKVPSPERDVSRNHVEVILEGWHVLIRDLGTTNGTTVMLPGETPIRLRANDQQVLEPGSLVSMADEVSFTFEAAS